MKRVLRPLLALVLMLSITASGIIMPWLSAVPFTGEALTSAQAQELLLTARSKKKATTTPSVVTPTPAPKGPIIEPQAIADYIFENGRLPDNFITKKEAQALGWDSSFNYVSDVAPGKSIGGDRFGNYEGLLPRAKGRQYYECDCYYTKGKRNAYRIIFSNDGLVYYTSDHYQTFTQMQPSKK